MKTSHFIEERSPLSFNDTVGKLIDLAEQYNWHIPAIHDLQKSLSKSGILVKPVKVIEICKPEYSGDMLQLNDERIISIMMPCRISVYEKDDEKTYIAALNPGDLASEMPENIANVIRRASEDTISLIEKVAGKHELINEPAF